MARTQLFLQVNCPLGGWPCTWQRALTIRSCKRYYHYVNPKIQKKKVKSSQIQEHLQKLVKIVVLSQSSSCSSSSSSSLDSQSPHRQSWSALIYISASVINKSPRIRIYIQMQLLRLKPMEHLLNVTNSTFPASNVVWRSRVILLSSLVKITT